MNPDWITSFEALKSVYSDEAYSNIAINEAISHHNGCRDSFVRNLVKGTLRDTILLDYFIDKLASGGIRKVKKNTLIILRMGIYSIRSVNSVPDHAAVNEAVVLAKKTARGTDRFVNAVLRSYIRQRDKLDPAGDDLALRYSFNQEIVDMFSSQYGDETENILNGLNTPPSVYIRTNTSMISRERLIEILTEEGISATEDDRNSRAIKIHGSGIVNSDLYNKGYFTIQSLSSMIAVDALSPAPGSRVLDMCAAPGGKSTMMSELMDNTGNITACDIHEHRLELIKSTARRMNSSIIDTRLMDGTVHSEAMEGSFDYILADVPCSGLGVVSTKPEIKFKSNADSLKGLPEIQKEILRNAVSYTASGGRICYSTCTLNKNENEKVVESVVNELGCLSIVEIKTLLPYNELVGFFYCIFEKSNQ